MKLVNYVLFTAFAMAVLAGCSAKEDEVVPVPMKVIFDSDFGNDVDDVFALQMLINYENEGKVDLKGITVSKSNPMSLSFARSYYDTFGGGNPSFGAVTEGPNPEDGSYLRPSLYAAFEGINNTTAPEGWMAMRDMLAQVPDSSVTIIAVGPLTNIGRLIDNAPELVAAKVKQLTIMGGNFTPNSPGEFNILMDIPAARSVFEKWPSDIVASGFEIGSAYRVPYQAVKSNYEAGHPLRVAYEHYQPLPYDRETWDLTAVLDAVEPDSLWFERSEPGKMTVDSIGRTTFTPDAAGRHRYLKATDRNVLAALLKRSMPNK